MPGRADQNIVDGEAQYIAKFHTGALIEHDMHIGVNYRYKEVAWTYLDGTRDENHEGIVLHDEVTIGRPLAFVGDVRLDYDPYLGRVVVSPRGSMLVHASRQSTLRAVIATAYRTPDFLESYLSLPIQLPLRRRPRSLDDAARAEPTPSTASNPSRSCPPSSAT